MLAILILSFAAAASAEAPLPPALPWSGESEQLIVADDHPWITPAERTGLRRTPSYSETVDWLQRLAGASPQVDLVSVGSSAEGRRIWMVVATAEGRATRDAIRASDKPTLLAHAGIHAGEIDGKDAGLMLLRDLTVTGRLGGLLDEVNLLFIPILNVDGHERRSPYGRINQRGPESMGWRTNARNLNLNRDFAKLDTAGVRTIADVVTEWQPDLYLDLHVTDGADYQYDITYGFNGDYAWSPAIARWLDERFRRRVDAELAGAGHIPGPLIFSATDAAEIESIVEWVSDIRYSNGWGDARHLPTVLVENHSLKPYRQRVLGTYVLLEAAMRVMAEHGDELASARRADEQRRPDPMTLAWAMNPEDRIDFELKGIAAETVLSPVSGAPVVRWLGQPENKVVPVFRMSKPKIQVSRPRAYLIPPAWSSLVERLRRQGIEVSELAGPASVQVEIYRLPEAKLEPEPFEGHARVTTGAVEKITATVDVPAGTYRVATNQPLGELAVLLLEPQGPDSFFQWGLLLEILQRTEYVEAYVMEPYARQMMEANPELEERFMEALANDPALAADPQARLHWFYRMTPYYDERYRVYPVLRETGG